MVMESITSWISRTPSVREGMENSTMTSVKIRRVGMVTKPAEIIMPEIIRLDDDIMTSNYNWSNLRATGAGSLYGYFHTVNGRVMKLQKGPSSYGGLPSRWARWEWGEYRGQ